MLFAKAQQRDALAVDLECHRESIAPGSYFFYNFNDDCCIVLDYAHTVQHGDRCYFNDIVMIVFCETADNRLGKRAFYIHCQ